MDPGGRWVHFGCLLRIGGRRGSGTRLGMERCAPWVAKIETTTWLIDVCVWVVGRALKAASREDEEGGGVKNGSNLGCGGYLYLSCKQEG